MSFSFYDSDDNLYDFSYSYNGKRIETEKLTMFKKGKGKGSLLYERKRQDIQFGSSFRGEKNSIKNLVSEDNLLFSLAGSLPNNTMTEIYKRLYFCSFSNRLKEYYKSSPFYPEFRIINENKDVQDWLKKLLIETDIGIDDFAFDDVKFIRGSNKEEKEEIPFPFFTHNSLSKENRLIFFEESRGTKELFQNAPYIYYCLKNGTPLFLDDDTVTLHNHLTRFIISLFYKEETNPKGAQIIYVSHDTALMTPGFIRRDEVWFTEKKDGMATELFSLSDFDKNQVRASAPFNRMYLGGEFGHCRISEFSLVKLVKVMRKMGGKGRDRHIKSRQLNPKQCTPSPSDYNDDYSSAKSRKRKIVHHILTEGKVTEPLYLKSLPLRDDVSIYPEHRNYTDPNGLLREALSIFQEYIDLEGHKFHIIFDVEGIHRRFEIRLK